MTSFELRDYQLEALAALDRAWCGQQRGTGVGPIARAAVVLPTGLGKTVIFAELAARWSASSLRRKLGLGTRVLVLVHRNELAEQARAKIHSAAPELHVGIVKAERNEFDAQVVIGSVQTLVNQKRRDLIRDVGLVIVDECHHANATSYVTIMQHFGCYDGVPTAGFTATLVRSDKLRPGDVWEEVVYTKDIVWGIRNNHLVDVRGKRVQVKNLNLSGVRKVAGDLQADEVADRLIDADAPSQVAAAYAEHASERLGAIFWPNVRTVQAGVAAFNAAGIPSAEILGTTDIDTREQRYDAMRAGDIQGLHTVGVLTEGWDMPQIGCVVPATMTQSAGKYMQMVGRGTRPHREPIPNFPAKKDLLVLDPVGVTGRHQLATMADMSMSLKNVQDDESLSEAADRAEREAVEDAFAEDAARLEAELAELELRQQAEHQQRIAREVSLFAESSATWLHTPRGTWFIPVGEWLLFLWPQGHGLFTLGTCRIDPQRPFADSQVIAKDLLQDGARAMAEKLARKGDPAGFAQRLADWRRPVRATAKRVKFARSLGIRVPNEIMHADLADAIFVKLAELSLGG